MAYHPRLDMHEKITPLTLSRLLDEERMAFSSLPALPENSSAKMPSKCNNNNKFTFGICIFACLCVRACNNKCVLGNGYVQKSEPNGLESLDGISLRSALFIVSRIHRSRPRFIGLAWQRSCIMSHAKMTAKTSTHIRNRDRFFASAIRFLSQFFAFLIFPRRLSLFACISPFRWRKILVPLLSWSVMLFTFKKTCAHLPMSLSMQDNTTVINRRIKRHSFACFRFDQ